MTKLIAPQAIVSKQAKLEHPVRVFAFAGIQKGAEIGRYTYINRHAFVGGTARLGRYCSISRGADIGAQNHPTHMLSTHPFQYNKLHFDEVPGYVDFDRDFALEEPRLDVGHDVLVGAKSVLKVGISVGTGAVIGANSFVNTDIPPYAIAVGSPAKVIKMRFAEDIVEKLLASDWWELLPQDMAGMSFDNIEFALEQVAEVLAKKRAQDATMSNTENPVDEDDPIISGLIRSLVEMDMPETIVRLIMSNAHVIAGQYDPLDEGDQEIVRNKLSYLASFASERDLQNLTKSEENQIAKLFRQKH